jgi:hypothetical protein
MGKQVERRLERLEEAASLGQKPMCNVIAYSEEEYERAMAAHSEKHGEPDLAVVMLLY